MNQQNAKKNHSRPGRKRPTTAKRTSMGPSLFDILAIPKPLLSGASSEPSGPGQQLPVAGNEDDSCLANSDNPWLSAADLNDSWVHEVLELPPTNNEEAMSPALQAPVAEDPFAAGHAEGEPQRTGDPNWGGPEDAVPAGSKPRAARKIRTRMRLVE